MIKKGQIARLDSLYQRQLLAQQGYLSILGGQATVIHHFSHKSGGLALRWYRHDGVALTHKQHVEIESNKRTAHEQTIIAIMGPEWIRDIHKQRNKITSLDLLDFDTVREHILGYRDNYVL